tara:strand:- start:480 stop:1664 length:1185 start_codon:yes stop_codon:yes gene_type:complete
MSKKFSVKDSKYSALPKSAAPKSPNEPDQYEDHSYNHREVKPDGTTVYYYDNGVKAIHHPKKTGKEYHRSAMKHHGEEAQKFTDSKETDKALSHLKARIGHRLALQSKQDGEESSVDKLYKDFGGATSGAGDIVAVASDPGIFTETYSGTNKKKKKSTKQEIEENKEKKKKASGPDKLDKWLAETEEKSLNLFDLTKSDPAPKYHKGRTGGLTPDASIKTPEEERDVEEYMEARAENAENRAFGLTKTAEFSNYVADLINDVRKELNKAEEEKDVELSDEDYEKMLNVVEKIETQHNRHFELMQHIIMNNFKENPSRWKIAFNDSSLEKMETDWSKSKKDDKLTNMPFLGTYKKSIEGRRENPPQVEKQYGAKRNPRPDPNGYRNPSNRRVPKD